MGYQWKFKFSLKESKFIVTIGCPELLRSSSSRAEYVTIWSLHSIYLLQVQQIYFQSANLITFLLKKGIFKLDWESQFGELHFVYIILKFYFSFIHRLDCSRRSPKNWSHHAQYYLFFFGANLGMSVCELESMQTGASFIQLPPSQYSIYSLLEN